LTNIPPGSPGGQWFNHRETAIGRKQDHRMATKSTRRRWHHLPELPYAPDSLQPCIDAATVALHHGKHHASYVDNLNDALKECPQLGARHATWLLCNLDEVPPMVRTAVRNNAGGHVNHSLYWRSMTPNPTGSPSGRLAAAIQRQFGSLQSFKDRFADAGEAVFGSGWVWLVRDTADSRTLSIQVTAGHDNPIVDGLIPILVNDVWEHAYYLNYQNRRRDYLDAWWAVVDWQEASLRYENTERAEELTAERRWENEGGLVS
jgi:superoxide dismutase, Fe-Mn family